MLRRKNVIFSRYKLATRRQQGSETLEEFLQALHQLSKKCDLQAVSAEQYRQELVRDAFINGLASSTIRQRLLENQAQTKLTEIFDQAIALDLAQRNSEAYTYSSDGIQAVTATTSDDAPNTTMVDSSASAAATPSVKEKRSCFFCGGQVHKRVHCPALNASYNKCGKTGHYAKVCRSNQREISKPTTASMFCSTLCAIVLNSLKPATIEVEVNGKRLLALVDTGSSESSIDRSIANQLKLKIFRSPKKITMASSAFFASLCGVGYVDIAFNGSVYREVPLGVMNQLCGDIILGHDFQKFHSKGLFSSLVATDKISDFLSRMVMLIVTSPPLKSKLQCYFRAYLNTVNLLPQNPQVWCR